MSTVTAETVGGSELEQVLRKTLGASNGPLSTKQVLGQLTGPFRRSPQELQATLELMAERGQVHRLGKYRGTERYWDRKPEDYARSVMLEKLRNRPMTRTELLRAVEKPLQILSKNRREEVLRELVRSGAVQELPPFVGARSRRLSPQSADPRDYVDHALAKIVEQLAKSGITEEQVHAAAREILGNERSRKSSQAATPVSDSGIHHTPSADVQEIVLARVMEIEMGTLVPFTEFRQGLDFQDRRDVDRAIWNLVRDDVVAVHKHHHPISMSEQEREASLCDEAGNLYHAISRRYR